MVAWVYENASRARILTKVLVATDSPEIAEVVFAHGGEVEMTDPQLASGSDRVAAVAAKYPEMDVVINLQGDEPFIRPGMLEELVAPYLAGESPDMTTLAYPLDRERDYADPGVVKVLVDRLGDALYFSRSPIPYFRQPSGPAEEVPVLHHMGLYAFRRDFLLRYTLLPQTPLEKAEALEQLRALEHGYKIRVCRTSARTLEINTAEELALAQNFAYVDECGE